VTEIENKSIDMIHPSLSQWWSDFLDLLARKNVACFVSGDVTIQFNAPAPIIAPSLASIDRYQPTPEQSGKKPPKQDIFDVLQSGVIPGAPVVDPIIATPELDE
jgi:hypothetical protein